MTKKSFFRERSVSNILKMRVREVKERDGLVRLLLDLNPTTEGLLINVPVVDDKFEVSDQRYKGSRQRKKYGDFEPLPQPQTPATARRREESLLRMRRRAFEPLQQEEGHAVSLQGYAWVPLRGDDKRVRRVSFRNNLEGARLYAYAESLTTGIDITPYEFTADGAIINCSVPSRKQKKRRYHLQLRHVPISPSDERRVTVWSLGTDFIVAPEDSEHTIMSRDVLDWYPQAIAAYYKVIEHFKEKGNLVPWRMSPFANPSQLAVDYYKKLLNNVVVHDETLRSRKGLRKLHVSEQSVLLAAALTEVPHDAFFYAARERDQRLRDYDWSVPKAA